MLNKILLPHACGEKDIAVVPRRALFNGEYWSGVRELEEDEIFETLTRHMEFHERTEELESNEALKQIIPYFLVKNEGRYLAARRRPKTGDTRLHGARLIGFGGHLRAEDINGRIFDWLKREFEEEIQTDGVNNISFLGLVNADSDADNGIHKVHIGLLFEVESVGQVSIREKDNFENEEFLHLNDLKELQDDMELWSKLAVEFLHQRS